MIRAAFLAAIAALLIVVPARAQAPTGSIAGKVVDGAGIGLFGVSVRLASPEAAMDFTITTDVNGDYFFGRLPRAAYRVTIELTGYEIRRRSLALSPGEAARVNVATVIASVSDANCPPGHWHWLEDVSAGYAFAHDSATGTSLPAGWTLAAAGSDTAHIFSWVGELSGSYRTAAATDALAPSSTVSALGGARKSYRIGRARASAQLLGGVSRIHDVSTSLSRTTYAFALQPGIAFERDINWRYRWSFRGEVGVRFFPFAADGTVAGRGLRLTAGVAYSIPRFLCL